MGKRDDWKTERQAKRAEKENARMAWTLPDKPDSNANLIDWVSNPIYDSSVESNNG